MVQKIIQVMDYKMLKLGCFISYVTHNLWGTTRFHIGPLLFLIYVNDLPMCSKFLKFILFADDINIFFSNKSIDYYFEVFNNELINLSEWFKANKLSLNLTKKQDILFLAGGKGIAKMFLQLTIL